MENTMKRILTAVLLFLTFPAFAATTTRTLKSEQHKATHTIILSNEKEHEGAGCSATAISEHVLLTAEHCNIAAAVLYLDQTGKPLQHPLEISERYFDHQDHMLLVLPGVSFKNFISYGAGAPLKQEDHYYMWGNPGLLPDQYREGYVTGSIVNPLDGAEVDAVSSFLMLSGPVVGGDSGSAIFSAKDGHLASVLTYGIGGGMFAGAYPLAFTSEQLAQAEGHGTFVYVQDTRPVVNVAAPVQVISTPDTTLLHVAESVATSLLLIALLLALPIICRVSRTLLCGARWTGARVIKVVKYVGRLCRTLKEV
jgi:hypothetical protein